MRLSWASHTQTIALDPKVQSEGQVAKAKIHQQRYPCMGRIQTGFDTLATHHLICNSDCALSIQALHFGGW